MIEKQVLITYILILVFVLLRMRYLVKNHNYTFYDGLVTSLAESMCIGIVLAIFVSLTIPYSSKQ